MIECIQTSPDILRTYISQKTQTPHVHTQDRNLLLPHPAGSLEERTVATHRDHEIGIEVITLEHLGSVQVVKMMVAQESIIVFIHVQLGTEDREHGQHLLNRCRLLHLIAIAKDGKFQFTMLHHYVFWVQRYEEVKNYELRIKKNYNGGSRLFIFHFSLFTFLCIFAFRNPKNKRLWQKFMCFWLTASRMSRP